MKEMYKVKYEKMIFVHYVLVEIESSDRDEVRVMIISYISIFSPKMTLKLK